MTPDELWHRADVRFRGIVHHVDGETVWASRGATVVRSNDHGATWHSVWTAPVTFFHRLASRNRLGARLTRAHIHHVRPLGEHRLCVVGFRSVYTIETKSGTLLDTLPLDFSRPLALCAYQERAFFGEYKNNPERGPVRVWASAPGGTDWVPVWTFEDVRHVHGIFQDPYTDALWITTGDDDAESGLWRTTDRFRTVDSVLRGGQQARIVQPLFSQGHVYFGTDAPDEANALYRLDRRTGAVEPLQAVDGPVFWGAHVDDRYFFSTVCEPSAVNDTTRSTIWQSRPEGWRRLVELPKDRWPMRLFQYGQVLFPSGPGDPAALWFTPYGTCFDQMSLRLPVQEMDSDA